MDRTSVPPKQLIMNPKSYKTLIWLVIILSILNISTLGTIGYFRYLSPDYKPTYLPRKGCEHPHRNHDDFFRDQMGFSREQMNQFGALRDRHFEEIKDVREAIEQNRESFFQELEKKNPDIRFIDSLNREVGNMHYRWAGSSTDFMIQAGDLCNDNQRSKFHRLMRKNLPANREHKDIRSQKASRKGGVYCAPEK